METNVIILGIIGFYIILLSIFLGIILIRQDIDDLKELINKKL